MDETAKLGEVIREAKRLEEDALYSEKAHFAMATAWSRAHYVLGVPAALTAAGAGTAVANEAPQLAIGCAVVSAVLTSLMTFLDTEKARSDHFLSGTRYSALRGKLRRFHQIHLASGALRPDDIGRIEQLAAEKLSIQESARHTGGLAYWLAKRSLAREEHVYQADKAT